MQANSERHHRLFFDETPDSCVQLVALLEYVIQSSLHDVLSAESMVCLLEKGSLYRGYMSLDDLSLVEKILYILQKFGEYNERCMIIDQELRIQRPSLQATLARCAQLLFEEMFAEHSFLANSSMLFQIGSHILLCHATPPDANSDSCATLITSSTEAADVLVEQWSVVDEQTLVQALISACSPLMLKIAGNDPSATAVTAEVAWLVSVDATGNSLNMSAELSRSYREALDDFLLDATQRFRMVRQEECRGRILELRSELLDMRDGLAAAAATAADIPGRSCGRLAEPAEIAPVTSPGIPSGVDQQGADGTQYESVCSPVTPSTTIEAAEPATATADSDKDLQGEGCVELGAGTFEADTNADLLAISDLKQLDVSWGEPTHAPVGTEQVPEVSVPFLVHLRAEPSHDNGASADTLSNSFETEESVVENHAVIPVESVIELGTEVEADNDASELEHEAGRDGTGGTDDLLFRDSTKLADYRADCAADVVVESKPEATIEGHVEVTAGEESAASANINDVSTEAADDQTQDADAQYEAVMRKLGVYGADLHSELRCTEMEDEEQLQDYDEGSTLSEDHSNHREICECAGEEQEGHRARSGASPEPARFCPIDSKQKLDMEPPAVEPLLGTSLVESCSIEDYVLDAYTMLKNQVIVDSVCDSQETHGTSEDTGEGDVAQNGHHNTALSGVGFVFSQLSPCESPVQEEGNGLPVVTEMDAAFTSASAPASPIQSDEPVACALLGSTVAPDDLYPQTACAATKEKSVDFLPEHIEESEREPEHSPRYANAAPPLSKSMVDLLTASVDSSNPDDAADDGDVNDYIRRAYGLIKERAVEDALDEVDHLNASSASASSFVSTPPHYGASANSTTSPHPASLATAVGSRPPTASAEGKLSAAVRSSSGGRMPQKELLVSHPARPSRADGAPAPSFASAAAGCLSKDASIALCNRIMEVRSQIEFEAQCERAKRNQRRITIGQKVLRTLITADPTVARASAEQVDEPPSSTIRDVTVKSCGVSFLNVVGDAPQSAKPVLSSQRRKIVSLNTSVSPGDEPAPITAFSPLASPHRNPANPRSGSVGAGGAGARGAMNAPVVDHAQRAHHASIANRAPAIPSVDTTAKTTTNSTATVNLESPQNLRNRFGFAGGTWKPSSATAAAAEEMLLPPPPAIPPLLHSQLNLEFLESSVAPPVMLSARAQSAGRGSRKLSNFPQVKNAVNSVCMAGSHFDMKRIEVFEVLEFFRFGKAMSPAAAQQFSGPDLAIIETMKGQVSHFVILFFQSKTLSFKGIYAGHPDSGVFFKIFGKGPREFTDSSVPIQQFLKFETASKSFKQLHVKTMSSSVDAIILDAVALKLRS